MIYSSNPMYRNPLRWPGVHCHMMPNGEPHVHEHFSAATHPGKRVIAVCGKGGVGKSALCALMTHALEHHPRSGRLLAIDADPALGLALALGIEPKHTIAGIRDELLAAATSGSAQAEREIAQKLDYLVFESLVECDGYAFLAMGRSRDLGCYCSINDLLRDAVEILVHEFDTVLIDGEAGLEQVNRQVIASVDNLVCVSDGSARAARTGETLWDMAEDNQLVDRESIFLVYNRLDGESQPAPLRDDVMPHVLGSVPADAELATFDKAGRPLLELEHENPAMHEVEHIVHHLLAH